MYIVTRNGSGPSLEGKRFNVYSEAAQWADKRHADTGHHYTVIKVESVYTTQTLAELLKEKA